MKPTLEDENEIRKYLLGQLGNEEEERLEEKLMGDDELYDLSLMIEDELVDDYATDALDVDERERFENQFLTTPDRRRKLQLALALNRRATMAKDLEPVKSSDESPAERKDAWWRRLFSPGYMKLAFAATIVIAAGVVIYPLFRPSNIDKALASLNKAYSQQRPTEARITEFKYAPYSVTRGEQEKVDSTALRRAENILLEEVETNPSPAAHHALGRVYLAKGEFDIAIEHFGKALKDDPNNAQIHSDYGAALLELGKVENLKSQSGKSLEMLAKSLEHLTKAIELDGSLLEALFNRALCYEEMGLHQQAEEGWRTYLEKDQNSRWADEAREKLRLQEEQRRASSVDKNELLEEFIKAYTEANTDQAWKLVSRNKEPVSGKSIAEQLLDSYIDNSLNGAKAEGQHAFNMLSFVGELEFQKAQERYTQTLITYYKKRTLNDLQMLKQARDLIKQGHAHYAEHQLDYAIEVYAKARAIFSKLGDEPEAVTSNYWIAYCHTGTFDSKAGLPLLKELERYCDANQFRWLFMRCLSAKASNYYVKGEHSEAAKHYQASLELAEEMGDSISILNCLDSLTELYRFIGNYQHSFKCIQRSFPHVLTSPLNPMQRLRHYSIVASAFASAGLWRAALEYQKESLSGDVPSALANAAVAYAHLAAIYARQKKYDEANESIGLAYDAAERIGDEKLRENLLAYSSLYLAHIYRESQDYDKAIATYTNTIESFGRLNTPVILYPAHKGRLYCYLANNDDKLIQEELDITLKILESDRSKILEADNRNNFFDREQNIYDIAIEYAYFRAQDKDKAFDYSEASRARTLLDMVRGSSTEVSPPLTLQDVSKRLPEPVQIIQYSVLDSSTVVWIISRDKPLSHVLEVGREKLNTLIKNFFQLISRPPDANLEELKRLSAELFDILINPIFPHLDSNKTICIVPDKALNYLPFESLVSPLGNYLMEDFDVVYAPSASIFMACSEEAEAKGLPGRWHILSVGNPSFDREAFPSLEDLRSAEREAETIAGFYDTRVVLTRKEAKEHRVKSEMGKAHVVHIAGHAVLDEYSSDQSKLLLAGAGDNLNPDSSEDGVLEAGEIYNIKLLHTRLAVLSSCHSGVDRYYKGEGMMSLARPFTAARVPLVVASLWKVDSDPTAGLMIDFHMNRRHRKPTIKALREAKLKMLREGPERYRHPYYWASFVAIGGHTNY